MSKRPNITTHDYLINAALPEQTDTYTVISHEAVISKTKDALTQKGFEIVRELYRCNEGAQVAQGVYHLKYDNDPNTDMGMLFAWANSYDKSMRFKCSIGAYVHTSLASIIGGNMDTFGRKHTGSADEEVFNKIDEQITNAELYFTKLVNDKEAMKVLVAPTELRASFMGRLYFINELVTGEQLGIIKSEFKKPSFVYKGIENSVWGMYNAIIYALQKAHPKTWMDQQRMIHYLLCKEYNITPDFVQPESLPLPEVSNQLDFTEELLQAEPKIVVEDAGSLNLAVPEQVVDEAMEDDSLWVCLSCGEMQGINAVFHDGQLCNKCVNP